MLQLSFYLLAVWQDLHGVLFFADQQCTVGLGHDVGQFVRRSTDNGLQMHFSQEPNAFNNAVAVHFVECLIKYNEPHRVAKTGGIVDPIELGKGGQHRDIERGLGLAAGFGVQCLGEQLTVPILIRGFQVEFEISTEIRVAFDVLLQLSLLAQVGLGIV